jgi:hypothetical protein
MRYSSAAHLEVQDSHGRTAVWYRDFWKQPILLPSETEAADWMPKEYGLVRFHAKLGPPKNLVDEVAAYIAERNNRDPAAIGLPEGKRGEETDKGMEDKGRNVQTERRPVKRWWALEKSRGQRPQDHQRERKGEAFTRGVWKE